MGMGPSPEQSIIREETITNIEGRPAFDRKALELFTEQFYFGKKIGMIDGTNPIVNNTTRGITNMLIDISHVDEQEGLPDFKQHFDDQNFLDGVYLLVNWRKDTVRQFLAQKLGKPIETTNTNDLLLTSLAENCTDVIQFAITQARRELLTQKIGRNYITIRSWLVSDNEETKEMLFETAQLSHSNMLGQTFDEYIGTVREVVDLLRGEPGKNLMSELARNLYGDYEGSDRNKISEFALFAFNYLNKISGGDKAKFSLYAQRLGIPSPGDDIQLGELTHENVLKNIPYIATYFSGMNYSHLNRKIK
jgi:hypothetical protein